MLESLNAYDGLQQPVTEDPTQVMYAKAGPGGEGGSGEPGFLDELSQGIDQYYRKFFGVKSPEETQPTIEDEVEAE
jgi:hypothetical protein